MSYTALHKGRLLKLPNDLNLTVEEQAEHLCKSESIVDDGYYNTWLECLKSELYDKYFYHEESETFYSINDEELDSDDSGFHYWKDELGNINYVTSFYNGGTCLSEMMEEGLKNL